MRHVVVGALCVAALASAVFDVVDLSDRIEVQVARELDRAADYWASLVMGGVDTDSATQGVLRQLREQIGGQRKRFDNAPFFATTPTVEDMWRANGLNPFRDGRWTNPRTDAELHALRASQVDARLAMTRARAWIETTERARMQRRVAIVLLVALCGGVWLTRQRRPRVMLGTVALDG